LKWQVGVGEKSWPLLNSILHDRANRSTGFAKLDGCARGTAVLHAWTEADQALWAGVLNFWFLGRVFDKVRP
jgi:hypothetical protein